MAEPGRTLVCQNRARRDRSRGVHFGQRSKEQAHALHPPIQQKPQNREMEIF
jgi:hypothetical protein